MITRRAVIGTGLGLATVGATGLALGGREAPSAEPDYSRRAGALPTVSVREFDARGDGRTDDTAAFQSAIDSLGNGGVVEVDTGTYALSAVRITHRHITVRLQPSVILRRTGTPDLATRGLFMVDMVGAHFTLTGGTIDLNGEGPMGIRQPGRIANRYASQTVAEVTAIAGPANSAIFALRASHVTVSGVRIVNTGETALLFRNCGHVRVERCAFLNIANFGVEFSFVDPSADGGAGQVPDRNSCRVSACTFTDIDDYGLGTGNGVGVGGGGGPDQGGFTDYEIDDCSFSRCQRDIHFEFLPGTWIAGLTIAGIRSIDARQGSFGLVGVRDVTIQNYETINPGAAPTAALASHYPSIYGGVLSGDVDRVRLHDVHISDRRAGGVRIGRSGTIAAGSHLFSAADGAFGAADVGAFLGIRGANPQGTWYVGRILEVIDPRRVRLDLPAGATVRGARFAFGGATREGLILNHGGRIDLRDVRIVAGRGSGLAGEPAAAGLRLDKPRGALSFLGTTVAAPRGAAGGAVGVRTRGMRPSAAGAPEGITVTGF